MNRTDIENQLLQESRGLPIEKLQESLDFMLFLKQRMNFHPDDLVKQSHPLGLLEEKAKCRIHHDMESEEMNWRHAISEKAKLLVSVEEFIKPIPFEELATFRASQPLSPTSWELEKGE
jgi:hypothetical protein